MLKYVDTKVTFAEIPNEITLCINLSNCPCHCINCHSQYLAEDIGEILTFSRIQKLLKDNEGVTAICFMGGDNDPKLINHYAKLIKELHAEEVETTVKVNSMMQLKSNITVSPVDSIPIMIHTPPNIKVGWYSGRQELAKEININNFDYIKLGPYLEEYGPLNCRTTNQKFYKVVHTSMGKSKLYDITYKFWKPND